MAAGAKVAIRLCCARLLRDACAQRRNACVDHREGTPADEVQSGPQRWDMRRGRSLRPPDLPQLRTAAKCIVQKCAEPFWAALLRLRPRRFASDALCG